MVCPDFLFASPTSALDLERKMLLADLDTTTKQRGWSAAFTRVDAAFLARLIESTLQVLLESKILLAHCA